MQTLDRYGKLGIGDPAQEVELDLDMLTSDFFVFTTTSSKGSKYDDLWSQSFREKLSYTLHCFDDELTVWDASKIQ